MENAGSCFHQIFGWHSLNRHKNDAQWSVSPGYCNNHLFPLGMKVVTGWKIGIDRHNNDGFVLLVCPYVRNEEAKEEDLLK